VRDRHILKSVPSACLEMPSVTESEPPQMEQPPAETPSTGGIGPEEKEGRQAALLMVIREALVWRRHTDRGSAVLLI